MTWELLTGGLPAAAFPEGVGAAGVGRVGELGAEHVVFQAVFDRAFAAESDDRYQSGLEFVESMRGATGIRPEIAGLPADSGSSRSGARSGVGTAAGVVLTSVQTRQQPVRRFKSTQRTSQRQSTSRGAQIWSSAFAAMAWGRPVRRISTLA